MTNKGPNPIGRLPYVPGIQPPYFDPQLAVGFSQSSITSQNNAPNVNGRTQTFVVKNTALEIISDTIAGTAIIQLLGGAPCWIGFSSNLTISTGFRLIAGEQLRLQPVVPVYAIGLSNIEVPGTIVQISLVETP